MSCADLIRASIVPPFRRCAMDPRVKPEGDSLKGGEERELSSSLESRQHVHRVHADLGDGVAAFHDEERRLAEPGDGLADLQVVGALQLELRDRVLLEGVDAEIGRASWRERVCQYV